jgi:hypothetical protein
VMLPDRTGATRRKETQPRGGQEGIPFGLTNGTSDMLKTTTP